MHDIAYKHSFISGKWQVKNILIICRQGSDKLFLFLQGKPNRQFTKELRFVSEATYHLDKITVIYRPYKDLEIKCSRKMRGANTFEKREISFYKSNLLLTTAAAV